MEQFIFENSEIFKLNSTANAIEEARASIAVEGMSREMASFLQSLDNEAFKDFNISKFTQYPSNNYIDVATEAFKITKQGVLVTLAIAAVGIIIEFIKWLFKKLTDVEVVDDKKFASGLDNALNVVNNYESDVETLSLSKSFYENHTKPGLKYYNIALERICKLIDKDHLTEDEANIRLTEYEVACDKAMLTQKDIGCLVISNMLVEPIMVSKAAGELNWSTNKKTVINENTLNKICAVLTSYQKWIRDAHIAFGKIISVRKFPVDQDLTRTIDVEGYKRFRDLDDACSSISNLVRTISKEMPALGNMTGLYKAIPNRRIGESSTNFELSWDIETNQDIVDYKNLLVDKSKQVYAFDRFHDKFTDYDVVGFDREFKDIVSKALNKYEIVRVIKSNGANPSTTKDMEKQLTACEKELVSLQKTINTYRNAVRKLDNITNYAIPVIATSNSSDVESVNVMKIVNGSVDTLKNLAKPLSEVGGAVKLYNKVTRQTLAVVVKSLRVK